MVIYLVICQYYQEPDIEKAYTTYELASEYTNLQNKKYDCHNAWYVTTLDVESKL